MVKVRISDLSIGDWVQAETNGRLTPPMRVVSLGEGAGGWVNLMIDPEQGDPFEYEPSEIRGIPIALEIIEKIGFMAMGKEKKWQREAYWSNNGDCYITFTGNCWRVRSYLDLAVVCDVMYVHELQHALRLMNSNQEINL